MHTLFHSDPVILTFALFILE